MRVSALTPELINVLGGVFALVLAVSSSSSLSANEVLSVLAELEGGDSHVGRVDWDSDGGTVWLVLGDLFYVDAVSKSVDLGDLSLVSFPGAVHDLDLVVSSDRERFDSVLLSEISAQCCTHQSVLQVRRGREMGLSALSSAAANCLVMPTLLGWVFISSENFIII